MGSVDIELSQLNICDQLRANSSFMKVMATLFYYGNQTMNAPQLVTAVRALELLPLRGETPRSTIQGIISTSRKTARDLKKPDPFRIEKEGTGRQAKYLVEIPDEPLLLKPVEHASSRYNHVAHIGKRQKKLAKASKVKRRRNTNGDSDDNVNASDIDIDTDDEFLLGASDEETKDDAPPEEDTIFNYSLLHSPPEDGEKYINPIDFVTYPIASYFAIVQQKGYSYPRFRSHEKIKIPKVQCEDKYKVADILGKDKETVGRVFILADGHGGPGCAEYFVEHLPPIIQQLCDKYDADHFDSDEIHQQFEKDAKILVNMLDEQYLDIKRAQLGRQSQFPGSQNHQRNSNDEQQSNQDTPQGETQTTDEVAANVDNDGCTLIVNIFFGAWMVNVNVGDSRSILISAPVPNSSSPSTEAATATTVGNHHSASTSPYVTPPGGYDKDYIMDVVFASQDHKPYLEHLVREILENGGEFIDSVQNRVIKVELDKLREDGNRQAKRFALKNARIRPKEYQAGQDYSHGESTTPSWSTQSAVRTTVNNINTENNNENDDEDKPNKDQQPTVTVSPSPSDTRMNGIRSRSRHDYAPSLNVARSCGDLDFKLNSNRKIISCEPDVTFIRIADSHTTDKDDTDPLSSTLPRTFVTKGISKSRRRNFLFMSTDGTFDYMYEETPERQNRAIAKMLGPLIEDGEKIGKYLLEQEEQSQTIQHDIADTTTTVTAANDNDDDTTTTAVAASAAMGVNTSTDMDVDNINGMELTNTNGNNSGNTPNTDMEDVKMEEDKAVSSPPATTTTQNDADTKITTDDELAIKKANGEDSVVTTTTNGDGPETTANRTTNEKNDEKDGDSTTIDGPPKPLLCRPLNDKETKVRDTKEKTLVTAARFFANREGAHGFFSATLQDYDDCTILLVEI
ncbi:hypothetical protein BCR42DRAFT_411064 [Absidia repens]|uniref:PPM-type phosphatase domain-containing protein n=1 Tax=Absidia repens TaxID=90262 RepID=A0A1X2IL69_9FUNG|nr:hypothetical protein BCR42DRAFT_411064 [Absidia repens]